MKSMEPKNEKGEVLSLEQRNRKWRRWFGSKLHQKIPGENKPHVLTVAEKAQKLLKSKKRIKHAIKQANDRTELGLPA